MSLSRQEKIKIFLENLKKERMRRLKARMDKYPQSDQIDYGFVKDTIKSIPDESYKHLDSDGKKTVLSPQQVVDMEYDNMLQEFASSFDCKVFWEIPNIKFSRMMITYFFKKTLDTNRLQSNNIFLTTDLFKKAILTPKKVLNVGYFLRTVYPDIHRINYSEIAVHKDENKNISTPVITTIQFDNDSNPDGTLSAINHTKESRIRFERLFSQLASSSDIDAIYKTASYFQDFSIHSYYVPTGISSSSIDDCCLLFRYDHCSKRHYNGTMPKLYKHIFPEFVDEPHFHFNCGFGGVYKLSNQNEQHNFGVGYAIGVTRLKQYLEKLHSEKFVDEKQRKLFLENDFGMPFLHYKQLDMTNGTHYIEEFIEVLTQLVLSENISTDEASLESAYKLMCMISNTKVKNLNFKQRLKTERRPNNDTFNC